MKKIGTIEIGEEIKNEVIVDTLPCSSDYDGICNRDTYFHPLPAVPGLRPDGPRDHNPLSVPPGLLEAQLHGRRLFTLERSLPEWAEGYVVTSSAAAVNGLHTAYATDTWSAYRNWNHDTLPSDADSIPLFLSWCSLHLAAFGAPPHQSP